MESQGREVHLDQNEARAGSTPKVVRYVLLVSIALAIIALSAIWITGAVNSPDNTGADADTAQAVQENSQPSGD
jgi:hypothetical protein